MLKERSIAITIASVFVLGALVAIPGATAQVGTPTFSFDVSSTSTGPVTPLQPFDVNINYAYDLKVAPQNLGGVVGNPTVDINVQCPSTITVSGATSDIIALSSSSTTTAYPGTIKLQFTVSRDATALESLSCDFTGSVSGVNDQGLPESNSWSNSLTVQADYFSLLEAKTDLKLKQGGPQKQIPFNLEITNFGNGQTKVNFETVEKPSGKWQGLAPDLLLLDEKDGNRASSTVTYTVVTPFKNGWNNEEGAFTIVLKPEYSFNPDNKGSEVQVTLVARVRGVYVPTLEPLVMVGAVIGSAMVARLMKNDEE